METYKKLKELILSVEPDVKKIFIKNQYQAAKRVRYKMQQVRILAKQFRQEIMDALVDTEGDEFIDDI